MSRSNGNGNGNGTRWGSSPLDPTLVDPTGQLNAKPVFPGYDGVPYRGRVTDLRADDPRRKQPQQHFQAHIEILDLAEKDDIKRYREICQVIANGFGTVSKEETEYDPDKKNWRVFIRWFEHFSALPKGDSNGNIG